MEYSLPMERFQKEVLASVSVQSEASVISYTDALPDLKPDDPWGLTFTIELEKFPTKWMFNLKDDRGHFGRLTFDLPNSVHALAVDPLPPGGENDVLRDKSLYKEWKMMSKVDASGIFAGLNSATNHAEPILRGNGSRCWGNEDFHSWMLNIKGSMPLVRLQGSLN